jgi:hypothetical protein
MLEKEIREKYYPLVDKQTIDTLPGYMKQVLGEPQDYGSICCSVAACALAAAWAANKHPFAGITRFQAGAVMWEFIKQWNFKGNKTGLRIIDFDNMLYSQYKDEFQKRKISKNVFESLQKEAKRLLDEDAENLAEYTKLMKQYEINLAAFAVKYPDYKTNPKKYDRIGMGTVAEWGAEKKKEESGFEFAPKKPYYFRGQIEHWQSIVDGVVPFGYSVETD